MGVLSTKSIRKTVITAIILVCSVAGVSGTANAHTDRTRIASKTPVTVEFFGDSTALTLGGALGIPKLESKYHYRLKDHGILGCGVAIGPSVILKGVTYITAAACRGKPTPPSAPLDTQPWPIEWKADLLADHPNVAVLLAGVWEVVDRQYNGQLTNILNPAYAAYIKQQLEMASNIVTASGANMVFITAVCTKQTLQADGTPWPEDSPARLNAYNQLLGQVAAEFPNTDSVVNLNAVVCPGDKFRATYKGVVIRQPDGVHFSPISGSVLEKVVMTKILSSGHAQMARAAKLKSGQQSH
jgi:hypothetical protein